MSGELLAPGDPLPHAHVLPPVPTAYLPLTPEAEAMNLRPRTQELVNAVAACASCGRLMVSRPTVDIDVHWVPLRWWHRRAWAKLRVEKARRIGGVAP